MDIESIYLEREKKDVTHSDCIYCMKCIEACPEEDALSFTVLGKKVLTSHRKRSK
jgi:dissimilatory sulfite reductase (desulfoviridin) alpha/beta subunit